MTQFEILSTISDHGGSIGYVDLLNLDLKSAKPDSYATKQLVSALIRDGLLSGSISSSGVVRIEPAGYLLLDQFRRDCAYRKEDRADRKAEQKRGFVRDLVCAIIGAVIAWLLQFLF